MKETNVSIWIKIKSLEQLNERCHNTLNELMGIRLTEIGEDYLKAEMPVDPRTHQPMGILHGGASAVLAETLGSIGSYLAIQPEKACVGIEVNANHVRSKTSGWVTGTARPLHIGQSTHVWDIRITDEKDRLICVARLTAAIIDLHAQPAPNAD